MKKRFFHSPCFWLGLFIFLTALLIRVNYVREYTDEIGIEYYTFDQTDNHTFHLWACGIAEGDWLCRNQIHPHHKWTAQVAGEAQWLQWYGKPEIYHQAPLYPYMVGAIYALTGVEVFHVKLFQAFLGACTCLLVFLTARLYLGRNTALFAGLLLAFSGFHLYYDAFILREGLITFLVMAFLFYASLAFQRGSLTLHALAGVMLGLAVAAKPNAMLLIPVYLGVLLFQKRYRPAAIFALGFLLPLLPIFARNAALGCPVLKTSTRGPTAFINGNARGQSGTEWNPPTEMTRSILREGDYAMGGVIVETLKTYQDQPLDYLDTLWRKTHAFFNSYEIPNNTNFYLLGKVSNTLSFAAVSYWFVASLGLLGLFLLLPRFREAWQIYLVFLVLFLSTTAFFIVARFRQPLVPLLCIFAGYSVVWLLKKARARQWTALLPALGATALLFLWTDHDRSVYRSHQSAYGGIMLRLAAQKEFVRAEAYMKKLVEESRKEMGYRFTPHREERIRKTEQAFSAFNRSLFYRKDDARHHRLQAEGYLDLMGATKRVQFDEYAGYTRQAAERALELDPGIEGVHKILGVCLAEQANREEEFSLKVKLAQRAMWHIREELKIRPDDLDCIKAMGFCYYAFMAIPEAVGFYKRYLKLSEAWDHDVATEIARIQLMRPDLDERILAEALHFSRDAYVSDPLNTVYGQNYADVLYHAGRIEEAVDLLNRLKLLDPDSREYLESRIQGYLNSVDDR